MEREYLAARTSHLHYYTAIPLYYVNREGKFGLYKPSGKALDEMRIAGGQVPNRLYIKRTAKLRGFSEVQRAFNRQLEGHIQSGNPESVKIGKIRIHPEILTAPRKLIAEEFGRIKAHPTIGYNLLDTCRFPHTEIKLCALQHHEKTDGSGYPRGLTRIAPMAEIVGLIDCYEALTNDDRPYRNAMDPIQGLTIIKDDVVAGRFSRDVFKKFAYSLL